MNPVVMRLGAVALAIVAAFVLVEGAVRAFGPRQYAPRRTEYQWTGLTEKQESYVFVPRSDVRFTWDGDPYGVLPPGAVQQFAVNRLGLRGSIPPSVRDSVLVLGDSFTFGEGVPDGQTFVEILDRAIPEFGFLNAGVSGQNTVIERIRLDHHLADGFPRAILLVYIPNDAVPATDSTGNATDFISSGRPGPSRLWELLASAWQGSKTEDWYRAYYTGEQAHSWDAARDAIEGMRDVTRRANVRFGVAYFPLIHELREDPLGDIRDLVSGACGELKVPFVDLTPALAAHADEQLWVHPTDHHPNQLASEVVAPVLETFVREQLLR